MASSSTLRGVLFDKDGTLIDFHRSWMPLYRKAAAMLAGVSGRPEIAEQLLTDAGYDAALDRCHPASLLAAGTNEEIARQWSRQAGADDAATVERVLSMFTLEAPTLSVPVDNLHDALRRLEARGLILGVATMDSLDSANATLARHGIDRHFGFVCGYDSGHGVKPERGMVDAFCAHAGLMPAEILLVGDTPHDLQMGRAASVGRVVGVLTGSSPRDALTPLADAVIESIAELEALLDGWEGEGGA